MKNYTNYTIEDQIKELEEKGVILDYDENKIKEILLDIGYYRLGFYWFYFKGRAVNFSDIVSLYYLDVDLRHLLIKYLHRIEIHIRTKIIYIVSSYYPNNPIWFVDRDVMNIDFINDFQKHYDSIKEANPPLKKHHSKYRNDRFAPAWKTLEFLSLGSIFTIFKNIKDDKLRLEIVKSFGLKKEDIFLNYFYTIKFIRNLCAHSTTLYDCNIPKGVKNSPFVKIPNENRNSIIAGIQVILFFLSKISENRCKDLEGKLEELLRNNSNNNTEIKKIIEEKMKYNL